MNSVTIDNIMNWRPCSCYSRERVAELFAGRERITALEIAALDIPARDRLWALLRRDLIPAGQLYALAHEWISVYWGEEIFLQWIRELASQEPGNTAWAAAAYAATYAAGATTDVAAVAGLLDAVHQIQLARVVEILEEQKEQK